MSDEPPSVADDAATMLRDLLALAELAAAEPLWRRVERLASEVVRAYDHRRSELDDPA
jgi:hypothetical protein